MSDYQFVSQDTSSLITDMIAAYETETGHPLRDADPDRLFLTWVASVIVKERTNQNYVGNQNLLSRARGENLDELGRWIFGSERKEAIPSRTTLRFEIGTARNADIIIPAGTRVTDAPQLLVWETTADGVISAGGTKADIPAVCQTAGTVGNGYVTGRIDTLIDVDNVPYDVTVSNITKSDGGASAEKDAEYFERLRLSLDSLSSAGSRGAYIYHAKSVSSQIADVVVRRPRELVEKTLTVWTNGESRYAFLGGDDLVVGTLTVDDAQLETDYTVDYSSGLLSISLVSGGALDEANTLGVTVERDGAGRVDVYALMDNGEIAGPEIKTAIAMSCSDDMVRPLTDRVSVKDAEYAPYSISLTYYTSKDSGKTTSRLAGDVAAAVNEYVTWQSAKIGRDINPSKLYALVMATGVKRVVITSPTFTPLADGEGLSPPQVAKLTAAPTLTNGGVEDE